MRAAGLVSSLLASGPSNRPSCVGDRGQHRRAVLGRGDDRFGLRVGGDGDQSQRAAEEHPLRRDDVELLDVLRQRRARVLVPGNIKADRQRPRRAARAPALGRRGCPGRFALEPMRRLDVQPLPSPQVRQRKLRQQRREGEGGEEPGDDQGGERDQQAGAQPRPPIPAPGWIMEDVIGHEARRSLTDSTRSNRRGTWLKGDAMQEPWRNARRFAPDDLCGRLTPPRATAQRRRSDRRTHVATRHASLRQGSGPRLPHHRGQGGGGLHRRRPLIGLSGATHDWMDVLQCDASIPRSARSGSRCRAVVGADSLVLREAMGGGADDRRLRRRAPDPGDPGLVGAGAPRAGLIGAGGEHTSIGVRQLAGNDRAGV